MKRSELKLTGETYSLSPDNWGDEAIVVDEEVAIALQADTFDIDMDEVSTNYVGEVEIATDENGNFYAILVPHEGTSWGRKTGEIFNENTYRECQNPAEASDGIAELYGQKWDTFDDEDD